MGHNGVIELHDIHRHSAGLWVINELSDFGASQGACLRHHTPDRACRSGGHSGYISTLSLMGKSIV